MIDKLAILGVGLIGGSLARALRAAGKVGEVIGYGRGLGNLSLAVELGVIDRAAVNVSDAVREADVIVLAVPVGGMQEMLEQVAAAMPPRAIVTDVGSVKGSVVEVARRCLGTAFPRFVPGHPIAGTEQSGVGASFAELFRARPAILTPQPETDPAALAAVRNLWQAAGADVRTMDAAQHDQILAASSHLPHLVAYALVDTLVRMDDHRAIFDCAGGGFRDFTRIASSDPVMWRDICLANREALLAALHRYLDDLKMLAQAIDRGDGARLLETFGRAKHARDALRKKS